MKKGVIILGLAALGAWLWSKNKKAADPNTGKETSDPNAIPTSYDNTTEYPLVYFGNDTDNHLLDRADKIRYNEMVKKFGKTYKVKRALPAIPSSNTTSFDSVEGADWNETYPAQNAIAINTVFKSLPAKQSFNGYKIVVYTGPNNDGSAFRPILLPNEAEEFNPNSGSGGVQTDGPQGGGMNSGVSVSGFRPSLFRRR